LTIYLYYLTCNVTYFSSELYFKIDKYLYLHSLYELKIQNIKHQGPLWTTNKGLLRLFVKIKKVNIKKTQR